MMNIGCLMAVLFVSFVIYNVSPGIQKYTTEFGQPSNR